MAHRTPASDRALTTAALVVAVDTDDPARPIEPELAELEALAEASGVKTAGRVVQRRARVDPATLVGAGKAQEIAELARSLRAGLVLVLNDLRPRQRKNLEKIIPIPIVDRTMLILDVFARHARSREGKLQVELAQLRYRQSNLIGAGADLSRLGGGIGTRGPGETKLEVDRRGIQARISVLNRQLEEVRRQRTTRRGNNGREPLAALVGYTNAGKSSLLNRLAKSHAFVADQPFATLDPTVRRVWFGEGEYVRIVDTVGFITDLPKDLLNAFRATLEELEDAKLLVHVVDAANPDWPRQMTAVENTLEALHLESKRCIVAFNKCDLVEEIPHRGDSIAVSARSGAGIAQLKAAIASALLLLGACAQPKPAGDPFVAAAARLRPATILLTMSVPGETKKSGPDTEYASGVVVASGNWGSDILTVEHALENTWNRVATIGNKRHVPFRIIARDADLDVALVRTAAKNLPVATLGSSADARQGSSIGLLGYPIPDEFDNEGLGLATSLNSGRVSALRQGAIEVTLPIVPGESGGPVFLADTGEVIGIAESRFEDERSIGFALPINDAKRFLHKHDAAHGF